MSIFTLDAAGKLQIKGKYPLGHGAQIKPSIESAEAMIEAVGALEAGTEKLTPELKKQIIDSASEIKALAGVGAQNGGIGKRLDKIVLAMSYAGAANEATVMADLVADPLKRKYLSADELKKLNVTDVSKLDSYITTRDKIEAAVRKGGENTVELEKLLLEHRSGAPAEVMTALQNVKVDGVTKDLGAIYQGLETKITDEVKAVELSGKKLIGAKQTLLAKKGEGLSGEALKPFESKVEAAQAQLKLDLKATEHRLDSVKDALKIKNKGVFDHIEGEKGLASEFKSASDATKKPNFLKRFFTQTEESIAEAVKSAEGNAEKLAKANKLKVGDWRKLRVGGALGAAGLVTYAVIASTGNSGPGKNAEQASRGQGQGAGLGAA